MHMHRHGCIPFHCNKKTIVVCGIFVVWFRGVRTPCFCVACTRVAKSVTPFRILCCVFCWHACRDCWPAYAHSKVVYVSTLLLCCARDPAVLRKGPCCVVQGTLLCCARDPAAPLFVTPMCCCAMCTPCMDIRACVVVLHPTSSSRCVWARHACVWFAVFIFCMLS